MVVVGEVVEGVVGFFVGVDVSRGGGGRGEGLDVMEIFQVPFRHHSKRKGE